jgi:hypothetical protein
MQLQGSAGSIYIAGLLELINIASLLDVRKQFLFVYLLDDSFYFCFG